MRRILLALFATLLLGAAAAQAPFPDVPAGHWAEDAVGRAADECIVVGAPGGEFRGADEMTRYEMAGIAGRLLDSVDRRLRALPRTSGRLSDVQAELAELAAGIRALALRLDRLEGEREAVYAALEERVDALEAEVARLRESVEGRQLEEWEQPAALGARRAAEAPAATAPEGDRPDEERFGAAATLAATAATTAATTVAEPPSLAGPARPWRAGLALGAAPQGPLLRAVAGHEDLLGFAGLRASLEVLFSGAAVGDAALAAHLTRRTEPRRFGAACWSGYVGAGAGYRLDVGAGPRASGLFLGAIVGSEYSVDDRWGLFFELALDYHPGAGVGDGDPRRSPVRPSLAAGVLYRF